MQDDRRNIGDDFQMDAAVKTTDQVQTVQNHIRLLRGVASK
jgi:hypothetical protein